MNHILIYTFKKVYECNGCGVLDDKLVIIEYFNTSFCCRQNPIMYAHDDIVNLA